MNHLLAASPILFPLLGVLINATLGRRIGERAVGVIASSMVVASFVASFCLFVTVAVLPADQRATVGAIDLGIPWIQAGTLNVPFGLLIDPLSAVMMLVVTGVGALIHIYSIGYMRGDERISRYFVYLNLFIASMLVLVMANSYLLLFMGWELVGLCSYLLIGFWFGNVRNAEAGRKAFVVNRIGDVAFILAIMLIFATFGTVAFAGVFGQAETISAQDSPAIVAITLLLFIGATGKSAQIPLHVWLPDAMAGPTPVSALIHAATMVTAGIYMMARSHILYFLAPSTQELVAIVGALTAFMAGSIALTQTDIKRVLAYSTISQLGFMVATAGLGAYVASIFHLVTHAFFKALLFLAAGSVIHAMEHGAHHAHGSHVDAQDMRNMGGLRLKLPVTFATFLVGGLALAGVFPLSGFFSKDEIMVDALAHNVPVAILLTLAAMFTAFYVGRQLIMVFFGKARTGAAEHASESPQVMTVPLVILAVLAALGGLLNLPGTGTLIDWLAPATGEAEVMPASLLAMLVYTAIAVGFLALAWLVYRRAFDRADAPDPLAKLGPLYGFSYRAWYIDAIYQAVMVRLFYTFSSLLASVLDLGGIDGMVNSIGRTVRSAADWLRGAQTGFVRTYGLMMLLGVALIITYFLWVGTTALR